MASGTTVRGNLGVCLGCLATDGKMYNLRHSGMQESYERLSGLYVEDIGDMPDQLCWQCAAYIIKFSVFRERCLDAYIALQNMQAAKKKVTVESIRREHGAGLTGFAKKAVVSMGVGGAAPVETPADEGEQNGTSTLEALTDDLSEEKFEVEYLEEFSDTDEFNEITDKIETCTTTNTLKSKTNKQKIVSNDITPPKDRREHFSRPQSDGAFQCEKCNEFFTSPSQLTKHKASQHSTRHHSAPDLKVVEALYKRKYKLKSPQTPILGQELKQSTQKINIRATEINLTQEQISAAMAARRDSDEYASALFRCDQCYKIFSSDRTYARHMRRHDPAAGEFQCDTCRTRYPTRAAVAKHVKTNHCRQWRCELCTHVAFNRSVAINHYRWHAGAKYECPQCNKSFDNRTTMLSHLRIKHPSEHICGACGDSFVNRVGLTNHTKRMHLDAEGTVYKGPYCKECDVQFASHRAWTRHILLSSRHEREKSEIHNGCAKCGDEFPSRGQLAAHARAQHPTPAGPRRRALFERGPQPCAECGDMMESAMAYYSHFRRAHPDTPYPHRADCKLVCDVCGKGYRCLALLKLHRHKHSEHRPYKCGECSKAFYTPLALRTHRITHTDERPCVCEVCGMTFKQKGNLERHMIVHTGERRFACGVCGRSYSCLYWTRHHVRTVHASAGGGGRGRPAVGGKSGLLHAGLPTEASIIKFR